MEQQAQNLAALGMADLVALLNQLDPEHPVGIKTFNSRAKAIARIEKLQAAAAPVVAAKASATHVVPTPTLDAPKPQPVVEKPALTTTEEKPAAPKKVRIIRVAAEDLLLQDAPALSYEGILAKLKEEFPDSSTSIACLRWYSVQLRDRGEKVPARPRPARQPKAKAE